ncbi:MAG: Uma2 family endonuclease [Lewinellaceae bacterium]|nr:Uma2 family endonuclease [Lewinellaceae bacterium]
MPTQALEQAPVLTHYRFSVVDYYRMAEVGILDWEAKVELLDGIIVENERVTPKHASMVNRLIQDLLLRLSDQAMVRPQQPIHLDEYTEPEPDISVVEWKENYYSDDHPGPEHILFLIEVAETSLMKDRKIKLPLYAKAGIPEVWIVDLEKDVVEVYSEPREGEYRKVELVGKGQAVRGIVVIA